MGTHLTIISRNNTIQNNTVQSHHGYSRLYNPRRRPRQRHTQRACPEGQEDSSQPLRPRARLVSHGASQGHEVPQSCRSGLWSLQGMPTIFRYHAGFDLEYHTNAFELVSSSRRWSARPILEAALVAWSLTSHAKSLTVSPVRPGCVVRLGKCGPLLRVSRNRPRTWRSRSHSFSRRTHSYRTVSTVPTEPISWITTRYVFILF